MATWWTTLTVYAYPVLGLVGSMALVVTLCCLAVKLYRSTFGRSISDLQMVTIFQLTAWLPERLRELADSLARHWKRPLPKRDKC